MEAQAVNPITEWRKAIQQRRNAGLSETDAIKAVVREDPELHAAYLRAYNEQHGRRVAD